MYSWVNKSSLISESSLETCKGVQFLFKIRNKLNIPSKILLSCAQTDATTPNIVAPTMLGVQGSCWQWCANGCNNSQQC